MPCLVKVKPQRRLVGKGWAIISLLYAALLNVNMLPDFISPPSWIDLYAPQNVYIYMYVYIYVLYSLHKCYFDQI